MRRTRHLSGLALAFAVLSLDATAQDDPRYRQRPDALLESRDREIMHAGEDPLELRGVDQGPDGFRSGTPALQRADVSVAMVDADELRRRRLAMYEDGTRFDSPVVLRAAENSAEDELKASPTSPDEPRPEEEEDSGKYAIIGAIAVACGLAAHFFLRRR